MLLKSHNQSPNLLHTQLHLFFAYLIETKSDLREIKSGKVFRKAQLITNNS